MRELEQLLGLFVVAVILAAGARRVGAPSPVFLVLGGATDCLSGCATLVSVGDAERSVTPHSIGRIAAHL